MVDGGSNRNYTQAYSKVLTLGSVHAKIQRGITICRFIELSNPTIWVKYICAKFHYYRICVIDFREGFFAPPPPPPPAIHEQP